MTLTIKISSRPTHPALAWVHAKLDQILNTFDTATARWFNVAMILLIIASTVIFVLDTMPEFDAYQTILNQLEAVVAILFSVEYLLRWFVASRPRWRYVVSMFAIFDLLAVLPFYFGFLPLGVFRTFRMIRMLRVLRVLRLLKLSRNVKSRYTKAQRQASAFKIEMQILAIGFITVWLIFSGLMYAIENPAGTKGFESVPTSMWYVIVTITTVGYGDVYPATGIGKAVASFIMLAGIGVIGTLTGIIGKAMMSKLSVNTAALETTPTDAKNDDLAFKMQPCENKNCGERLHHRSAKFCRSCGVKLKRKDSVN